MADIQWYPGHMTKARRAMEADLKLVDIVVEIVDARIPLSSRNPDLEKLTQGKEKLFVLNKADLADEKVTAAWKERLALDGASVVKLDSRSSKGFQEVKDCLRQASARKHEKDLKRGIKNRPVRMMVAGIPNVGKSTFINSLAGKAAAKTGDKPGVTKGNQWISLNKTLDLLDTPGILWPKFEDRNVGIRLALIGAVSDDVLIPTELASEGMKLLHELYPGLLAERCEIPEGEDPYAMLDAYAAARNTLKKGGEPDTDRAARLFINDFRKGAFGRLSLERP